MNKMHPRIGIGVFVWKGNSFLIGLRKSKHGKDTWGLPGGHLEFGETPEQCAKREVKEETNLDISKPTFYNLTNDIFKETNTHYVTLFYSAKIKHGEPQVCEPEKLVEWKWVNWEALPSPLFLPLENLKIYEKKASHH